VRPIRLVAEGFGALRDRVELDLDGIDFFVLVGPTGSGKSTVIDAICFALYGSIPRYTDERQVGNALSLGASEARVELVFRCAEQQYRIVRVVSRGKRSPTSKVQLDRLGADGAPETTLAARPSEVKEHIGAILGLTFDQFTKCVVLPQGAFATLLHETGAKRNDLLLRLLDLRVYERIAQLAGARAGARERDLEVAQRTLAQLGVVDDAALEVAATRAAALATLHGDATTVAGDDDAFAARLRDLRRELEQIAAAVAALDAVDVPPALRTHVADRAAATEALEAATKAVAQSHDEVERLTAALDPAHSAVALQRAIDAHDRCARAATELDAARARLAAADGALAQAATALDRAGTEVLAAEAAHDELRRRHTARDLARHLVAGEPCPVCQQPVARVPERAAPRQLGTAERAVRSARESQARAAAAHAAADREHAAATELMSSRSAVLDESRVALGSEPFDASARAALAERLAAAVELESALARARDSETQARHAETKARNRLASLNTDLQRYATEFHNQRDALARAQLPIPAPSDDLAAGWEALASWSLAHREEIAARAKDTDAAIDECARDRAALITPLRARAEELGVELPRRATVPEAGAQIRDAATEARLGHQRLTEAREQAAALRADVERAGAEATVARALHRHLGATQFEPWLVRRALEELAARAAARLLELSGGRYALGIDDRNEFDVVDHANAGDTRPVRSLSGGETFQASLALALALAEQVAELSPHGATALESMFLDEGFGTLDPDALDIVAGTIEHLGAGDRMIGIVTHVRELAERVPVRYRVHNDGRTSTIERER
jgi:exonuclease SbcC